MAVKKKVLIVVAVAVLLLIGVIFIFLNAKKKSTDRLLVDPLGGGTQGDSSLNGTDLTGKYLVWEDQAGFEFSYPADWLFDTHDQDVTNYANIDITKRGNGGGIKVLAADSKYKTITDWTKKDSVVVGSSFVETGLGGLDAQKALLKTGGIVLGAIDEGIIYTIELKPDESGYWEVEYDKLISSFKLVYPTGYPKSANNSGTGSATAGSADIIEEAEEVVE